MRLIFIVFTFFSILFLTSNAQFPAACDQDKGCLGNVLTFTVSSGKGAHYVDVDTSSALRNLDSAITFEAWINPKLQPGKRVFIGGVWGPNKDANDQWVVYIEDNNIYFVINADGAFKGDADNTVASVNVPNLYSGWQHIAATWNRNGAKIYVNGNSSNVFTNPQYPITKLHRIDSKTLSMQLGSCNGLYDDSLKFRTFKGDFDEVRVWNRVLTDKEIDCQRLLSLAGNETGLILYYRCNEGTGIQNLCDATGRNIIGRMRSGAQCGGGNRSIPAIHVVTPGSITQNIFCTGDTTFNFSIIDTSLCGSTANIRVEGRDAGLFTPSPASITFKPGETKSATVRMRAGVVGAILCTLVVDNSNRCGKQVRIPITINRTTEFTYSTGRVLLDTLWVGCTTKTTAEKTIKICNTSNRPLKITSASFLDTNFFWSPDSGSGNLPQTIAVGKCYWIKVGMKAGDTTRNRIDTFKIISDDVCPGSGKIPVQGQSQDVLMILNSSAKGKVESMDFGSVCPGDISDVRLYQYRNFTNEPINIDTITILPNNFFGRRNSFPIQLLPKFAYQETYIRFRPDKPGPFTGEAVFKTTFRGCQIVKKIKLKGTGISVDVDFLDNKIDFGNVVIGNTKNNSVIIKNNGTSPRNVSVYLKVGDAYSIISAKGIGLSPGGTSTITLLFRPREQKTYLDTLCIFDTQCYGTQCIPITGAGVYDELSFAPPLIQLFNTVGCDCKIDSIAVKNITSSPVTINNVVLNDVTGKFTLITNSGNQVIQPNSSGYYSIKYCPNDLTTDRADQSILDINLSNGRKYQVLVRATSVVPRLYVTPLTTYGVVEVGWQKTIPILIENSSSIPINVTKLNLPPGYVLIASRPALPVYLNPRDSLWFDVQLKPTAAQVYAGDFLINTDKPCVIDWTGKITGTGVIIKLEAPISLINYGLVKPCECSNREIPLPNYSSYIPMSIDSIWIDPGTPPLPSPRPAVFSWKSKLNGSKAPFTVAPLTVDTLVVSFCPNIPSIAANVLSNAVLHIKAKTPAWKDEFKVSLSGRRELNLAPSNVNVQFPATRVDTSSASIAVNLDVPSDPFSNPSGDSVVISGIQFVPDIGVFTATALPGNTPPTWVVKRGSKLTLNIVFSPRSPKSYLAKLNIITKYPCNNIDTSITLKGNGFAPAFGMQMAFDTTRINRDTILVNTCDDFELPIFCSRDVPQRIIDMFFRLNYDSTALKVLSITSPYSNNVAIKADTGGIARGQVLNGISIKAGEVARVKFKVISGKPFVTPISIEEVSFDSDSLVFYKIVAAGDKGTIIITQPLIKAESITFDTVGVQDCLDKQIIVRNPGLIPVRFDSLILPPGYTITSSLPPIPVDLQPNDSVIVMLKFCPTNEQSYDSIIRIVSNVPCKFEDTSKVNGFGYCSRIAMSQLMSFDTVNLKYCADRIVKIWNPDKIDMRFDSLILPKGHKVLSSNIPYPTTLKKGDTIELTVRFCPYIEEVYDTTMTALSNFPCSINTSGRIFSIGYAPPFPMKMSFAPSDTLYGTIADTVLQKVIVDKDLPQSPIDLKYFFEYNKRALQYLGIKTKFGRSPLVSEKQNGIEVIMEDCENVTTGEIAEMRFAVAVPDSNLSYMGISPIKFTSDSIFWVKPVVTGDNGNVSINGKCNITKLNYNGGANKLKVIENNNIIKIEMEFFEDGKPDCFISNLLGEKVFVIFDGKTSISFGKYSAVINSNGLPQGNYICTFRNNKFIEVQKFVIKK